MHKWIFIACVLVLPVLLAQTGPAKENHQSQQKGNDMQNIHKNLSVDCFNKCWTYIDRKDRSAEDNENMILLAYSSLWHWKQRDDSKPRNLSVGYWQISRAHALAGHYEMAKLFGEKCLEVGEKNNLSPFYVGYAYEALARAEILHKNMKAARDYVAQAQKQIEKITDKEEKKFLSADIVDLKKLIPGESGN